jgi:hypothetical protein
MKKKTKREEEETHLYYVMCKEYLKYRLFCVCVYLRELLCQRRKRERERKSKKITNIITGFLLEILIHTLQYTKLKLYYYIFLFLQ